MARPVTLFTGQWADLTLETVAEKASAWGFDGLELACWGDHFEVDKALEERRLRANRWAILNKYNLKCFAISNHLVGQCVCDPIDERHKGILPDRLWGDGDPEGVRQRGAEEIKNTAKGRQALWRGDRQRLHRQQRLGHALLLPAHQPGRHRRGLRQDFAARGCPSRCLPGEGIKFGLEVHPTEIAYDMITSQRALDALDITRASASTSTPATSSTSSSTRWSSSTLSRSASSTSTSRIRGAPQRSNSILSSHLDFGDPRRGWDFVSPGRGDVRWDPIIRALNRTGYEGPLSIEWEDSGMDREYGAQEALAMVRGRISRPSMWPLTPRSE
jgi:hypothetical protein